LGAHHLTSKKIAIVQSSYIPWKGYFDLIHAVDEFVLFDDVQYTRRDWRNRNRIKSPHGTLWLSVPVSSKGKYLEPIKSITVSEPGWAAKHWRTIAGSYSKAPYFATYAPRFEELYLKLAEERLSAINRVFIDAICEALGIATRITWSMDYEIVEGRTERLVSLCQQAGATTYISGPSAREYIDPTLFEAAGVELVFFDYGGYPEYPQLHPPFDHFVSALDLLFSEGPGSTRRMLTFG
jgi:hypothetical protein